MNNGMRSSRKIRGFNKAAEVKSLINAGIVSHGRTMEQGAYLLSQHIGELEM